MIPMFQHRRSAAAVRLCALVLLPLLAGHTLAQGAAQEGAKDFSLAERLLFMTDQLGKLKPPLTLRYSFRKSGALESAFDDKVEMQLKADDKGKCCRAEVGFLTGERRLALPDLEQASANPVLLYFLERDVRDMKRLTKGSEAYYRKRIRMAVYNAAKVTDVTLNYQGRSVRGQRVDISPYDDDPARNRFEKFARKSYQFDLSEAVPGGVHGVRSVMRDADDAKPEMVVEELRIDGATPSKSPPN